MIQYVIQEMIETYQQDSGKNPAGLALGPREYRELCYYCNSSMKFQQENPTGMVTHFMGYPVYLKELPGVDLILGYQEAFNASYR
jgi:hypothetical protein